MGLELAYRLQTAYSMRAERPESEDPDVARDALPRGGVDLGELSMSGWRIGFNLFVRF